METVKAGLIALLIALGLRVAPTPAVLSTVEPVVSPTPTMCEFKIAAVGDVMLGRTVMEQMEKKRDWKWPFIEVADRLKVTDLTVGNLEAALVPGCYQKENRFILCSKPEARAGLISAGFDVMSLANNHTLNWGRSGYDETVRSLNEVGIETTDGERAVETEYCGVRVRIMGLDDTQAPVKISSASDSAITVAMVHWGVEYVDKPTQQQRQVAEQLSLAGVDVIIGSHPHWVQPVEKIGETLVFWSLGNFVFDQMWSEETRRGGIAEIRLQITDNRLTAMDYELVPVRDYEYGQPRVER